MPDALQFATYARLLRLTPVDDPALPPTFGQVGMPYAPAARSRRLPEGIVSLLIIMILPVCVTAGYFWLLAADRYESEARFVLRTPGQAISIPKMTNLLQSPVAGGQPSDDGYVVRDYLELRDAMHRLEQDADLKAAFAVARRDPMWRFPNPFTSNTAEGLYWHYQRMVFASFDNSTGMSTLKVQAFTPMDAQRLAAALLDAAEALVNRLNQRAREDAIALAEEQVERARQRAFAALGTLTAFRERERLIDPSQATFAVLETIARLADDTAQTSVQINELRQSSPKAPQIASLLTRRAALESQIAMERQRLAGNAQAIAPRIAEYEGLMLEREFAVKALMVALTAVETARVEALRQQVYLERVAAPNRPDYPAYPWRIMWCLATLVVGYVAWRTWRSLVADALRHSER